MSKLLLHIDSKFKATALVVMSLIVAAAWDSPAATAQELQVSIGPPIIEHEVIRGQTISDKIFIINRSNSPLPFKIFVRNWTAKGEDGEIEFFEEPDADIGFSARKWVELSVENIILEPGEKQVVPFTLRIPENAEPGGHYAMVNFESLLPERTLTQSGGPVILPQIGSLVFLTVHVPYVEFSKDPLTLHDFSIPREELTYPFGFLRPIPIVRAASDLAFIDSSLGKLRIRIENMDIIHHRPKGEVQIFNSFGQAVLRKDIPATTILPRKARLIPIDLYSRSGSDADIDRDKRGNWLQQQLIAGRYTALVSLNEGDQVIIASVRVWAFPWKLILLGIILLSPFIYFVIKWRRRLLPALFAFIQGRNRAS